MAAVVRLASSRAAIAQTATAALTAQSTLGVSHPVVRVGGVRAQNNRLASVALAAPVALASAVESFLGTAGLTAPVALSATARTGSANAVVRVASVHVNQNPVATATLRAPVALGASLPVSSTMRAPVSLVYINSATVRVSFIGAYAIQAAYDWNGEELVPRPSAFMVAPVSLTAASVGKVSGATVLGAPVSLGATAARITSVPPASLTAPVSLGAAAVGRVPVTSGLTAPVSLQGNLSPVPIQAAASLAAPVSLGSSLSGTVSISASLFASPVSLVALSVGIPLGQGLLRAPVALGANATDVTASSAGLTAPVALTALPGSLTTGVAAFLGAPVALGANAVNLAPVSAALSAPVVVGADTAALSPSSAAMTAEVDLGAEVSPQALMTAPVQLSSTITTSIQASLAAASSLSVDSTLVEIVVVAPVVPMPNAQPFYVRQVQDWAVQQERQRHVQALYMVGEPAVFVMMWKVEDFEAGLVARCSRCSPTDGSVQSRVFAVYEQPLQALCPVCFGTTFEGGVRARVVRPAIFTDADEDERKSPRGALHAENLTVESTNDFRTRTGDYVFRTDGSRYQLGHPERVMLRTGYNPPSQRDDSLGYARIPGSREDRSSVAYIIPPTPQDVSEMLTVPYQFPSVVPDYTPGPLIPDLVSTAGEFE